MGSLEAAHLDYYLPDGRAILRDVSFRVGEGRCVALIGPNGSGKSTLVGLVAGELKPDEGHVTITGTLGVMPQFVGKVRDDRSIRDLLLALSPAAIRDAGVALARAELDLAARDERREQLAYAEALAVWADVEGYNEEVLWDVCTTAALGLDLDHSQSRPISTLSGGEQKRLVLELMFRGLNDVLVLDEPDNYLDVPGKRWLEEQLHSSDRTILFVSHDRELLTRAAESIVSIEPSGSGSEAWVHGGGYDTYGAARAARFERFEEVMRRWSERRAQLVKLVADLRQYAARSDNMASRYQAAQTRLRKFDEAGAPPEPPRPQHITMRLRGGRTGVQVLSCVDLGLDGLVEPFDLDVYFGERVALLGANGSGKSHFLRLLSGEPVGHGGRWKFGARVEAGYFAQTNAAPSLEGRQLLSILQREADLDRGRAMSALRRYELDRQAEQVFDTLSGGQQARLQILLLELRGSTLLLLDEPTDNLDLESAEALQSGLEAFEGTVLAVTHDRWFARSFDRFVTFGGDGKVRESAEPVWDEHRPVRSA